MNNQTTKTKIIKYDYVWGLEVLFYLMSQNGEFCIGESEDCELKS